MEWAFLVVGMLLVAAIWDIGRRYVDKIAVRDLGAEVKALRDQEDAQQSNITAFADDLAELRGDVVAQGAELRSIKSGLEGMKAQRARPAWPRMT